MRRHFLHAVACAAFAVGSSSEAAEALRVAATTTIVADFVRAIGGPAVEVSSLLPCDADPHAFQPRPADLARLAAARLVFANGLGLEAALRGALEAPEVRPKLVCVSEGIEPRRYGGGSHEDHGHGGEGEEAHGDADPHVWFDPVRVAQWTVNIERALAKADPARAADYAARAEEMRRKLGALDAWIREQIATLPSDRRRLVADHASFGYLADRYGLVEEGTLLPGVSTLAQPSARDLARLEDAIRRHRIGTIFTGSAARSPLLGRVADDAKVRVVRLYTCALSAPGGPAADYFALMRFNVGALVEALK